MKRFLLTVIAMPLASLLVHELAFADAAPTLGRRGDPCYRSFESLTHDAAAEP